MALAPRYTSARRYLVIALIDQSRVQNVLPWPYDDGVRAAVNMYSRYHTLVHQHREWQLVVILRSGADSHERLHAFGMEAEDWQLLLRQSMPLEIHAGVREFQ